MTKEDKKLLLKDLSARLSYGVMCQVDDGAAGLNDGKLIEIDISKELVRFDVDYYWDAYIDDVKPYLRPMSSMTDEELIEFLEIRGKNINSEELRTFREGETAIVSILPLYSKHIDWLNAHHFDYRGLIEKGLALEAPKKVYNIN